MMSDTEVPVLVGAPYAHPRCWVGCTTFCRRRNALVEVHRLIGLLSWPASRDSDLGGHSLSIVVTDELIRAAATENEPAFTHWFGVSPSVFYKLRTDFTPRQTEIVVPSEMRPLIAGPYEVPKLERGDLADCLRLGRVKITSCRGPLKWPRCVKFPRDDGGPKKASVYVNDELVRALKNESGLGFAAWFGTHVKTYSRIRQELGIAGSTPGFRALQLVARNDRTAKLKLRWTKEATELLGTAPDHIVAHQLGIRIGPVRDMRQKLKIPFWRAPLSTRKSRRANSPENYNDRSPDWNDFRNSFIVGKACAACGGTSCLTVHHIKPFQLFPDLEFVESNLIVLCEDEWKNCHHRIGHNFDWYSFNPHVVEDAALSLSRIRNKPNAVRLLETA